MKVKFGLKAAIAVAVLAVVVAAYVGVRSFGGGTAAAPEKYTAPAAGIDMQKLEANPNTPPGITGAGGG